METHAIRNKQSIQQLYNLVLPALAQIMHQHLAPVLPLFENFVLEQVLDTWTKDPDVPKGEEISIDNGNIQQLGLRLRLEGFNKAGVEPFDITKDLIFKLEHTSYALGPDKYNTWLEKQYLERWQQAEFEMVADKWIEELVDAISGQLEKQ